MRLRVSELLSLIFFSFVFWFVSGLPGWILAVGGPPPVLSYIAFLAFVLVMILIRSSQGRSLISPDYWARTRLIWLWLFAFVIWTIGNFFYSSQSGIATQRLITALEMAAVFGGFFLLLGYWEVPQLLGRVMAMLVILSGTLNLYDFFQPTFSTVPGRAAGMYINPTISGFVLTVTITASLAVRSLALRRFLVLIGAIGVFVTFSRGSWLLLFVSVSWLFMHGHLGFQKQRKFVGLLAIGAIGGFAYSILSGFLAELVMNSPLQNYLDSNTLARLGLVEFATDASASERQVVARFAIDQFMNAPNPLFGYGLGHTSEWEMRVSTHNMYLLFLVEGGMMGLFVYLSLFALLWRNTNGLGKLLIIQLSVFGFFSHNLLDTPDRVFFFALVASGVLSLPNSDPTRKWS